MNYRSCIVEARVSGLELSGRRARWLGGPRARNRDARRGLRVTLDHYRGLWGR